jgi:hypothetical protein
VAAPRVTIPPVTRPPVTQPPVTPPPRPVDAPGDASVTYCGATLLPGRHYPFYEFQLEATVEIINHSSTKANYAVTVSFLNLDPAVGVISGHVMGRGQGSPGYAIGPGQMAVLNLDSVIDLATNMPPALTCQATQVLRTTLA